ncbi:MAG: hypothetical protein IPM64_12895 [Phycisphaerales bacterium]|nr:hypothetical protein [Phycisphaerales bacterium]
MPGPLILPFLLPALGCATASRVELLSFADPHFPERYSFTPEQCAQWTDAGGDLHVAASAMRLGNEGDGRAISQLLHIHVFWRPLPGKTPSNRTATDAVLRYVVQSPEGTFVYAGTGFVWTRKPRFGPFQVDLERAELRLVASTPGAEDLLGEMRITGRFYPANDPAAAVGMIRSAEEADDAAR